MFDMTTRLQNHSKPTDATCWRVMFRKRAHSKMRWAQEGWTGTSGDALVGDEQSDCNLRLQSRRLIFCLRFVATLCYIKK